MTIEYIYIRYKVTSEQRDAFTQSYNHASKQIKRILLANLYLQESLTDKVFYRN